MKKFLSILLVGALVSCSSVGQGKGLYPDGPPKIEKAYVASQATVYVPFVSHEWNVMEVCVADATVATSEDGAMSLPFIHSEVKTNYKAAAYCYLPGRWHVPDKGSTAQNYIYDKGAINVYNKGWLPPRCKI